jgi:hypothetical protein
MASGEENYCNTLKGDYQLVCHNQVGGILKCEDYPHELMLACENGVLNPHTGERISPKKAQEKSMNFSIALVQVDKFIFSNGEYTRFDQSFDYNNVKARATSTINGEQVKTMDMTQTIVKSLKENLARTPKDEYSTKIIKLNKQQMTNGDVYFEGSNMTLTREIPFQDIISSKKMISSKKGQIKSLIISSNDFKNSYEESFLVFKAFFAIFSKLAFNISEGEIEFESKPTKLSDYICKTNKSEQSILTCKIKMGFSYSFKEI